VVVAVPADGRHVPSLHCGAPSLIGLFERKAVTQHSRATLSLRPTLCVMVLQNGGREVTRIGALAAGPRQSTSLTSSQRGGAFRGRLGHAFEQEKPIQQNLDLQLLGQE
jgi:hypothetical protein